MTKVSKIAKDYSDFKRKPVRKLALPIPTNEVREAWSVRSLYQSPLRDEMYFDETRAEKRFLEIYNQGYGQAQVTRCAVVKCTDNKWRRINFAAVNIKDADLWDGPQTEIQLNVSPIEDPES